jgi:hypothetical protein
MKTDVETLLSAFRRACRPPTDLERMESDLLAALDVARDTRKAEAARLREIRQRLRLLR